MTVIRYDPHPVHDGWMTWAPDAQGFFFDVIGELAVRPDAPGAGRVRWWPAATLGNTRGAIHGGAILGFVDIALFAGARACGIVEAPRSATVECSCQFLAPARLDSTIDAVVELMRETGRLAFLRGVLEQDGERVAAFSGVIRKIAAR